MNTKFVSTLVAVILAAAPCLATTLLDTEADYSTAAQGTNGIQYGYYTSADQTTGTFDTTNISVVAGQWAGVEAFGTPVFDDDSQHPSVDNLFPAVRRYTVGSGGETAYSGLVRIMGQFGGGPAEGGGSVIGFVTVDGVNLFSGPADFGTIASFDFTTSVTPGSHIDFGVMANGDPTSDLTAFSATVLSVPEPSKSLCLLAGLALSAVRRSRPVSPQVK